MAFCSTESCTTWKLQLSNKNLISPILQLTNPRLRETEQLPKATEHTAEVEYNPMFRIQRPLTLLPLLKHCLPINAYEVCRLKNGAILIPHMRIHYLDLFFMQTHFRNQN